MRPPNTLTRGECRPIVINSGRQLPTLTPIVSDKVDKLPATRPPRFRDNTTRFPQPVIRAVYHSIQCTFCNFKIFNSYPCLLRIFICVICGNILSFFLSSFLYLFICLFIYLFIHSRQDSFFLSFNSHFYSFIPYYLICVFLHLLCLSIHLTLVSCPLSVFLYLHYYCLFCLFVNGIFLILFSVVLFSIKHRYYSCTKEGWAIWISHTTRINTQI